MSAGGFHVHGPHDHELEHAAAHSSTKDFAGRLAVATAVIATVGALFAYMGGLTQANAGLYKNEAAIKKTEASNQWNYYQAKSSKQNLSELGATLTTGDQQARYRQEVERYNREKDDIKKQAEKLEADSKHFQDVSEASMHVHHRWAQSMTLIQIAIALAAITLLTRRAWLSYMSYSTAAGAIVLGVLAAMHI